MQKVSFCHNCGKKIPAIDAKFCPSCGTSLASLSSKPNIQVPNQKDNIPTFTPFIADGEDDDEDSYIDKIVKLDIKINELQVDIIKDRPIGESLGTMFANPSKLTQIEERPKPTLQNTETFLKEFAKEAGTTRKDEK